MFKPKYRAVQSLDLDTDYWSIFRREWYSFFWKPTNIHTTYFQDAVDIIEMLKTENE